MKITILGCGASGGVPLLGCDCSTCSSGNPRNRRMRSSILWTLPSGATLLIDTGPDLREQCLQHDIRTVDSIFYTHAHADHCHGIDDVRSLNYHMDASIPAYSDSQILNDLQRRFGYVFQPKPIGHPWYRPSLIPLPIDSYINETGIATLNLPSGDTLCLFVQWHGKVKTWGVRVGDMAYSIDVNLMPDASLKALEGVKVWVVDCLRYREAPSHAHMAMTLGWIDQIKPDRAYLTHMGHDLEYDTLCKDLPAHIRPTYDGLEITL